MTFQENINLQFEGAKEAYEQSCKNFSGRFAELARRQELYASWSIVRGSMLADKLDYENIITMVAEKINFVGFRGSNGERALLAEANKEANRLVLINLLSFYKDHFGDEAPQAKLFKKIGLLR